MQVPYEQLSAEALQGLIEQFVMGEGTDYGDREVTLATKVEQVKAQLRAGTACITFDPDSQTCYIAPVT